MTVDLATAKRLLAQMKLRELLGIPQGVRGQELEKACKKARVQHHPDKGGDPELASVIGAAVDELLEQELNSQPSFASFTYNDTRTTFKHVTIFEILLQEAKQWLNTSLTQARACLDEVGYADSLPDCIQNKSCKCAAHGIQRLQNELKSLSYAISVGLNSIGKASAFTTKVEFDLCSELQHLISEARDVEGKSNDRAKLLQQMHKRKKDDEERTKQTAKKKPAKASKMQQRTSETTSITQPLNPSSQDVSSPPPDGMGESCNENKEADSETSSQDVSSPPPDGMGESYNETSSQDVSSPPPDGMGESYNENKDADSETSQPESKDPKAENARKHADACFPRLPAGTYEIYSDTVSDLAKLNFKYRNACKKRDSRVKRGQATEDVDEQIHSLIKQAWIVAGTLSSKDCSSGFPPASLWKESSFLKTGDQIKTFWCEYRKAIKSRSTRVARCQPTNDIDEKIEIIKQQAWQLVQISNEGD